MERPNCCCSCESERMLGPIPQTKQYREWWNFHDTYRVYLCADCGCMMYHFLCTSCDIAPY